MIEMKSRDLKQNGRNGKHSIKFVRITGAQSAHGENHRILGRLITTSHYIKL